MTEGGMDHLPILESNMTEDNSFSNINRINNPYALSCFIFTGERKDYAQLPELPGIYFLVKGGIIYIGYGMNLKKEYRAA